MEKVGLQFSRSLVWTEYGQLAIEWTLGYPSAAVGMKQEVNSPQKN